eukprot:m51a1_g12379 hypothetical protein (72) ;mRNA; r:619191-619406
MEAVFHELASQVAPCPPVEAPATADPVAAMISADTLDKEVIMTLLFGQELRHASPAGRSAERQDSRVDIIL